MVFRLFSIGGDKIALTIGIQPTSISPIQAETTSPDTPKQLEQNLDASLEHTPETIPQHKPQP